MPLTAILNAAGHQESQTGSTGGWGLASGTPGQGGAAGSTEGIVPAATEAPSGSRPVPHRGANLMQLCYSLSEQQAVLPFSVSFLSLLSLPFLIFSLCCLLFLFS